MLDIVDASHFSALVGKECALHIGGGNILPIVIDAVTSKPLARNPYAPETRRLPFSVSMSAVVTEFTEGPCVLDVDNFGQLDGVYVSRVAALGRDPNRAYYQIAFS